MAFSVEGKGNDFDVVEVTGLAGKLSGANGNPYASIHSI
jgi:hypothetical protein